MKIKFSNEYTNLLLNKDKPLLTTCTNVYIYIYHLSIRAVVLTVLWVTKHEVCVDEIPPTEILKNLFFPERYIIYFYIFVIVHSP